MALGNKGRKCCWAPVWPLRTHSEQVDQIHVRFQVVRGVLQGDQLAQGNGELVHFDNVHFVLLHPVWENDVDRYQVLQVHAEDGDFEAVAVGEGLAVIAIIAVGGDQLCHFVPVLGKGGKVKFFKQQLCHLSTPRSCSTGLWNSSATGRSIGYTNVDVGKPSTERKKNRKVY